MYYYLILNNRNCERRKKKGNCMILLISKRWRWRWKRKRKTNVCQISLKGTLSWNFDDLHPIIQILVSQLSFYGKFRIIIPNCYQITNFIRKIFNSIAM